MNIRLKNFISQIQCQTADINREKEPHITVWKVNENSNGSIVESRSDSTYTSNTSSTNAIEQQINYIIKVDDTSTDKITVRGDTDANGFNTAHEGEKVYLAVSVPDGYKIKSFFNADGANSNVRVITTADGRHYLEVPRGGGVQVGVTLEKAPESGASSSKDSGSTPSSGAPLQSETQTFNNVATNLAAQGIDTSFLYEVKSTNSQGEAITLDINSVLKTVDTLSAVNNFISSGLKNPGVENVKGAGIVSFNNMFINSTTDTISVPVTSQVVRGTTYTVAFSNGLQIAIPCVMDGVLQIPFNKAAEGVTFIIYETVLDPTEAIQLAVQQALIATPNADAETLAAAGNAAIMATATNPAAAMEAMMSMKNAMTVQ